MMRIRKKIYEIDKIFDKVSRSFPFSTVTPLNVNRIKNDFFKKKLRNPILNYEDPSGDLLKLRREVSAIKIDEKDILDTLIIEKQEDLIKKIDLFNSIGCYDFSERSIKLYGTPDRRLVKKAYDILEKPKVKSPKSKYIDSKKVIKLLKENFEKYGFDYKIRRGSLVGACDIEPSKHKIVLRKRARFSRRHINKLIVHEIGVHTFRYENAVRNKLKIFAHGLKDYLGTEEGLALYIEEKYGLINSLRIPAGHVIAVYLSQTNSFYDVYRNLRKYFDKNTSFKLTIRAKRGLYDTSQPGGYTKDYLYLKGYFDVKRFFSKGGSMKDLYMGKIGIKDIPYIKKLGLKKPKYIPAEFILAD